MQKRALGRGIGALIPEKIIEEKERIIYLPTEAVRPNPYQPRKIFNQAELEELIQSIKEKGVIQPILVRRVGPHYELIAGERRLRAAKSLQINEIPAIVKEVSDEESLELSLIENVQREQLNPIEEAHAYQHLMEKFGITQEKISETVGKSRASIANSLRLLKLPQEIQEEIIQGRISFAHGKVLLEIEDINLQRNLAWKIVAHGLSVKELEALVKQKCPIRQKAKRALHHTDPNIMAWEESLQHLLGTKVKINQGRKRGNILIEFYSSQDLQRIINILHKR
ncbi:MAG: ParB/RepB/Spo0J family partition protein [Candidatus Omnitrophica bacterium]|nr:ParB/RepB/Spo0J family partition protein [Candidatus Omnitrophota bacterium]